MTDSEDIFAIQRLIAKFANSFDLKDWRALGECLADELDTDYFDLRGTPAETLSRERFVELRRLALQALQTHHLAGNVDVALNGSRANANASMAIFRRVESGETFDTHCLYAFGCERAERGWVIRSIVQKVLMNAGRAQIHGGAKA